MISFFERKVEIFLECNSLQIDALLCLLIIDAHVSSLCFMLLDI